MSFLNSAAIPEHIAKLLSPADRKRLGKGAMTLEDAIKKTDKKAERLLQDQIIALLSAHRGIVVIYSRMDRKTTTPPGTPDLIFSVYSETRIGVTDWVTIYPCAWECKVKGRTLSEDQEKMRIRMGTPPNAWRWRLIESVDDARRELAEMKVVPRG